MSDNEDTQDIDDEIDETIKIPLDDEELDDIEFVPVDEDGIELKDGDVCDSKMETQLNESRDEYLRLYAEFENYKKRAAKDKEQVSKYANESILLDILPTLDHLEIALKHARDNAEDDAPKDGLAEGVEMTLRELIRTLDRYGLSVIEAEGKEFDPEFHHAVSQAERDDMDEGMVVEELRRGYVYNGKVVRATMVAVSKKPTLAEDNTDDDDDSADEGAE